MPAPRVVMVGTASSGALARAAWLTRPTSGAEGVMEAPTGFVGKVAGLAAEIARTAARSGVQPQPMPARARRRQGLKGITPRGWTTAADGTTVPERRAAHRRSRRRMQAQSRRRNRRA